MHSQTQSNGDVVVFEEYRYEYNYNALVHNAGNVVDTMDGLAEDGKLTKAQYEALVVLRAAYEKLVQQRTD
jgi:hypothetical protein